MHTLACQSKNQAVRSKELSVELQERIVSRHRSGEGYQKMPAAIKVLKNSVAPSFLNGRSFEPPRLSLGAGRLAKLSNQGRRDLVGRRARTRWSL